MGTHPPEEKIPLISKVAELDITGELKAWEYAKEIARLIGVTNDELELIKRFAMDGHYYRILSQIQVVIAEFVKPKLDEKITVFDPFLLKDREITLRELSDLVDEAEIVNAESSKELAAILEE